MEEAYLYNTKRNVGKLTCSVDTRVGKGVLSSVWVEGASVGVDGTPSPPWSGDALALEDGLLVPPPPP